MSIIDLDLQGMLREQTRQDTVKKVKKENPSLTLAEAATWVKLQEDLVAAKKCCPCQTRTRAELVRHSGGIVGTCVCACHS